MEQNVLHNISVNAELLGDNTDFRVIKLCSFVSRWEFTRLPPLVCARVCVCMYVCMLYVKLFACDGDTTGKMKTKVRLEKGLIKILSLYVPDFKIEFYVVYLFLEDFCSVFSVSFALLLLLISLGV